MTIPIENRNLEPGTKLIATYKKETYHALVIAGDDRKVRYTLTPYDGKEYKSPSSLGTAITRRACNGWTFWSVDPGEATATEAPTSAVEEPEEPAYIPVEEEFTESTDLPKFYRVPNQKGVDPGQVRLHCYTCRSSFIVPDDKNPETCPAGHEPV
ncbi:MAG: hypothetical protein ACE5Q6_25460 [Dehalococcoidia bacterium]